MALLFGLGGLIYIAILLLNAVAILSEDRFLARIGWGTTPASPSFGSNDNTSIKSKIVALITSVRMLTRWPLIVMNTLVIVYEILLG